MFWSKLVKCVFLWVMSSESLVYESTPPDFFCFTKESHIWHAKLEHKNMPFILSHVYVSAKSEWKYAKNILGWKKDVTLSHKIRLADTCFFRKAWLMARQRGDLTHDHSRLTSLTTKVTDNHWATCFRARKISAIYGIIFLKKDMWDLLQKIYCVKNWEKPLDK